jgi:hypothetical protein
MKPKYSCDKWQIKKDGHTMFLKDVVHDFECLQQKVYRLEREALLVRSESAGSVLRLEELQADPDTGKISEGHICKHDIRWPHRCDPCAELAWERRQLEKKKPDATDRLNLLVRRHDKLLETLCERVKKVGMMASLDDTVCKRWRTQIIRMADKIRRDA